MDELLQKYILGELTPAEQEELLHKVDTDASFREQLYEYQNLNALIKLSDYPGDENEGRKDYAVFRGHIRKRNFIKRALRVARYAAVAAVLIISTWWITYANFQKTFDITTNTLYVPTGQRACLTLQDGTTVWLNARSTLIYPSHFFGDKREVTVIGEAFFDVAKDHKKPFIVSAKGMEVEVTGTRFNVSCYPESDFMETSLIEGAVQVKAPAVSTTAVTLKPNQRLLVANGKMKVEPIDHHSYFLWTEGIYSFEDESFYDIVRKLELYYDVKIIIQDPSILNFTYTGKFRQRDGIDEILRIIQKIQKFKVSKNEDRSVITLSR